MTLLMQTFISYHTLIRYGISLI